VLSCFAPVCRRSGIVCVFLALAHSGSAVAALDAAANPPASRPAVNLERLDAGDSLVFVNYSGNLWHVERHHGQTQASGDLSLTGGTNFGLWQYRQQGNLSIDKAHSLRWNNLRSYLQRPLPALAGGSQLTLGQLQTRGHFFVGLTVDGLNLASDPRILTNAPRDPAPVVHGVANTNARISIRQKGREIYRTTVLPGAFVISDVYPVSYNGDLDVVIEEADGTVRSFSVPFSALPEVLPPGQWRYGLVAGRTRNTAERSGLIDATYQRGISRRFSVGVGMRLAPEYQALATEAVMSGRAGALGLSINHSRAHLPALTRSGWMSKLGYRYDVMPSGTQLGAAIYRYPNAGYRELDDLLDERAAIAHNTPWPSAEHTRRRSRIEFSLSQNIGERSHLHLSAFSQNWHRLHHHQRHWQLGYDTTWRSGARLELSLQRQDTAMAALGGEDDTGDFQFSLSLTLPLGGNRRPTLSSSYHYSLSGGQLDADLSGQLPHGLHYNLGASHVEVQRHTGWHGSLQQHLPNAVLGLNASHGVQHTQVAANAQGAFVLHRGGLTLGPSLGSTFALIEAKHAPGASVGEHGQTKIDRHGYALLPELTPYRDNRVRLDTGDVPELPKLKDDELHVAPYPGAAVKLIFHAHGE